MSRFTRLAATSSVVVLFGLGGCFDSDSPRRTGYGEILAVTSAGRLVSFDLNSSDLRTSLTLSGMAAGEVVVGIDMRRSDSGSRLYALTSMGRIYTVDLQSGMATLRSTLTPDSADATSPFTMLEGTQFGVDFNPVADRLRVVSNTGQNLRVNVDTGATITDGPLNASGTSSAGITSVGYTNSFDSACRTTLFYVDTAADRLLSTTDPNNGAVTVVGPLGISVDTAGAFEIATTSSGNNIAFLSGTSGTAQAVYTVALSTGTATLANTVSGLDSGETLVGLATWAPGRTPDQQPGDARAITSANRLVTFNTSSPDKLCTNRRISGLAAGENVLGMDARPADGSTYVLASSGRLYTLDISSATVTLKSTLAADPADATDPFTALSGTDFGVDFNPVPDRLRVVSNTGQNLRINVDTGATITDTPLNPPGFTVTAAAYTNAFAGAGTTTLYGLDVAGDRLVIQGQPSGNPNNGDILAVGALNAGDVQSIAGFDIDGRNNSAFAALNIGSATASDLYSINLSTGAASKVNLIGGGESVRGFTLAAAESPRIYGITTDNHLVSFRAATPGTLDSDLAITGLGGATIVGADFRPATGTLLALTSAGGLFRIDTATGAATSESMLTADAADATSPFTALAGTSFGVDFNPVADRLRVVSSSGQNLRINAATGATITDTSLNPPGPVIVASAYTQDFAGAASTRLFAMDAAAAMLYLQTPPNNGTLVAVGSLGSGLAVSNMIAFDIVGGDDGLALASMVPTGATQSTLYRVNLATGLATAAGAIGTAATMPLSALAIQLR